MAVKGKPAAQKVLTKKAAMKVPAQKAAMKTMPAQKAAMKKMPAKKAAMKKMPAEKAGMKNHAMKSVKVSTSPWKHMTEKKMRASEKEPVQKRMMYSVIRMSAQEKKRVWNEDMDECVGEWVEVLSYNKSFRQPPPCPRKKWIQAGMEERGWVLLKVKLANRPSGWLKIESHELPHL